MLASRRENTYFPFDIHKIFQFLYFLNWLFLQMYSLVPFSKSYESRFFNFIQFWGKIVTGRGARWEKIYILRSFLGHPRSFKVIWVYLFSVSPLAILWPKVWKYENESQRYAHICFPLLILTYSAQQQISSIDLNQNTNNFLSNILWNHS